MCGILALLNTNVGYITFKEQLSRLNHRGPDASGSAQTENAYIGHTRLSIVDPESGAQPFQTDNGTILTVNGEIYNHEVLNSMHTAVCKTRSDCESIAHIYDHVQSDTGISESNKLKAVCCFLDGVYAFVLVDGTQHFAARDPLGVIPLYYGYKKGGGVAFASEIKALLGIVDFVAEFPPGYYYHNNGNGGGFAQFFNPTWKLKPGRNWQAPNDFNDGLELGKTLISAVKKRMMSDVPWGVLLSGGLDSSIIAAIAARESAAPINTFAIGLEGSPDLEAAEVMAKHIKSNHRSYPFTVEEALSALPEVIRHLETYDVTTIRAGTPMYLLARRIKATGVKMVLSGEGADELFGGYMYFHNCPNETELYFETQRKVLDLHYYDCLRANKAMSAWGVECRVPFLDMDMVDYSMGIHPGLKMPSETRIEKHILRETFCPMLPESICWRQKEQFSDGVGYKWIDSLKSMSEQSLSWKLWRKRALMFPWHTPRTYEAMYYRMYFDKYFNIPGAVSMVPYGKSCACSSAEATQWRGNEIDDASGRSVKNHIKSVKKLK